MIVDRVIERIERDPALLAGALAGAWGTWMGARVGGGDGPGRSAPALARGALMGAVVGGIARRWTWSAARVEEELLDAEAALESADGDEWPVDRRGPWGWPA